MGRAARESNVLDYCFLVSTLLVDGDGDRPARGSGVAASCTENRPPKIEAVSYGICLDL
jgi:hypothetical protein